MTYNGQPIEVLSTRKTFGSSVSQIRFLSTGNVLDVLTAELKEELASAGLEELVFRSMAARIRNETAQQKILAPFESNIIPLPHQILALEKVMTGSYIRFLMADEVGMGKTIEAGLVLKELKLRGIVKRTLIIVPVSAMQQWQSELKKHFNESFNIYDSDYISTLTKTFSRLDADNDINLWAQHNQIIVSMDALKPLEGRQGWSQEKVEEYNRYRIQSVLDTDFDLLIIDECHKVGGSSLLVGRFQMAQTLASAIPNVLLLSATPHRGKSDHFRRILGLLDSDAFSGDGMPSIKDLEPYVVRTEKRQAIDHAGKPLFNKRNTERVIAEYNSSRHSRQEALYENVTKYVVEGFNLAQQTKNSSYGFVMVLFQRMISSSTQAIFDAMANRKRRLESARDSMTREQVAGDLIESGYGSQLEMDFEAKLNEAVQNTKMAYQTELEVLSGLVREAQDTLDKELDVKFEYLIERMAKLKAEESNTDLKFLIFTEYTGTQRMLARELAQRGGYVCETINGSMDFETRVTALRRFKSDAQILVSTDAAGESLNMQFAHIIINYDLPWNPMVLEQRIGRVDRIGQTFEVLAINLMINNSIDQRVYEVIETKLNQIMDELGIDKSADVLDSTLEADSVNRLFMTSLLDPKRFEGESKDWLADIREKLNSFKTTEGALPTVSTSDIRAVDIDAVKYSPLPTWLEALAKSWLRTKGIPFSEMEQGLRATFPGRTDQIYTFDTKTGLENPIPEPLTMQHELIQTMLAGAVPHLSTSPVPVLAVEDANTPDGYFMVWGVKASNMFESRETFQPLFLTDGGDTFTTFAQDFWTKLSMGEVRGKVESVLKAASDFGSLQEKAEELLGNIFNDLKVGIEQRAEQARENKGKAFEFQMRQVTKIGIEHVRNFRTQKYRREHQEWLAAFDSSSQVVPSLTCMLAVRVVHG